ncbi:hypothetical protein N8Z24_00085 [bacterium]|nr:hypothetical protein [bacterium]
MKPSIEKFLEEIAKEAGYDASKLKKCANPLENSMFSNLIDGALKGLEMVALATFDIKLTAIVKLLQSWVKDKRAELEQQKQNEFGGYSDSYSDDSFSYDYEIDPYRGY